VKSQSHCHSRGQPTDELAFLIALQNSHSPTAFCTNFSECKMLKVKHAEYCNQTAIIHDVSLVKPKTNKDMMGTFRLA
jgi:hypothetical protein